MPKRIDGYSCDKCGSFYKEAQSALNCEAVHPAKETMKLEHVSFAEIESKYGNARWSAARYPYRVRIRLSEEFSDFATYTLERVGPRGL